MLNRQNSEARAIARELTKIAYALAGEHMNIVFRRYGLETKKYNPAQPRVPAKQHGAGQWTKRPSSGALAGVRAGARALGVLAANPEAAPALGTALLPGMLGGIGISRAAGLNAVVGGGGASSGMGMTPILGLPFQLSPTMTSPKQPRTPEQERQIDEDCDEAFDSDIVKCQTYAAMYGGSSRYTRAQIRATCRATAEQRYSECLTSGSPSGAHTPLFTGR